MTALAKLVNLISFDIPEDIMICRFLRPLLEEYHKICFAPVEVARHFAVELENINNDRPFGFHGLSYLPMLYQDNFEFLLDNLPPRCFKLGSQKLQDIKRGFSVLSDEVNLLLDEKIAIHN